MIKSHFAIYLVKTLLCSLQSIIYKTFKCLRLSQNAAFIRQLSENSDTFRTVIAECRVGTKCGSCSCSCLENETSIKRPGPHWSRVRVWWGVIVKGCSAGNIFPLKNIEYFLRNKETSTCTWEERQRNGKREETPKKRKSGFAKVAQTGLQWRHEHCDLVTIDFGRGCGSAEKKVTSFLLKRRETFIQTYERDRKRSHIQKNLEFWNKTVIQDSKDCAHADVCRWRLLLLLEFSEWVLCS